MSDKNQPLYKIQFINNGEQYEVYVKSLSTSSLFGFIEIGDFVWNTHSSLVLDTSEEKLKSEFENVERTYLPMHNVLRIDQVQKQGTAKITSLSDKVTQLNRPVYTPSPKK
ncbi:DUF1820 family protein [Gayadomonas joobiniege]|uniref:DUF1820 family protein n=1 Tax=Gayadomonas joobiniege TaxID=1234606 RepID=UPI00036A31B5|nr:DUF1820 family protein [Gayadomonas joobiniege]